MTIKTSLKNNFISNKNSSQHLYKWPHIQVKNKQLFYWFRPVHSSLFKNKIIINKKKQSNTHEHLNILLINKFIKFPILIVK